MVQSLPHRHNLHRLQHIFDSWRLVTLQYDPHHPFCAIYSLFDFVSPISTSIVAQYSK